MRVWVLGLVPAVFIGGLLCVAYTLHRADAKGSAPCAVGSCPLVIHASDAGKVFSYAPGARFVLYLDETKDPKARLRCAPGGVIEPMPNAPEAVPPMYAVTLQAIARGQCVLASDSFSSTIVVE